MGRTRRVGFSEFLGVSSLVSLGVVIVIALGGMVSNVAVLRTSGSDTPFVLAVAIALLLPVIAVFLARATEARGGGTAYAIVRRDRSPAALFATGWLTLGGYLSIGALMVNAIASRIDRVLDGFLGMDVPLILLLIPVAVAAGLGELVAPSERSKTRHVMGWLAIGIYVFLIFALFLRPPPPTEGAALPTDGAKHWLSGAALFASVLWFIDVLLDYRRQFQRSDTILAAVVSGCWIGATLLSIAVAALILAHPDVFDRFGALGDESLVRHQIGIAALVITVFACGITLFKSGARLLRISGGMARDGLLPAALEDIDTETRVPASLLAIVTLATVLLAWMVPVRVLVGIAAATFLWTVSIIIIGGLRGDPERADRGLKLPGRSAIPIVALIVVSFNSLVLPTPSLFAVGGWLVLGFVNYAMLRGGTRELTRVADNHSAVGEDADDGEDPPAIPDAVGHRILICLGPASRVAPMIRLGAELAKAHGGDAVVLEVVSLLEQLPRGRVQRAAEEEWKVLQRRVLGAVGADDPVHPLVRIAPTTEAGILATANGHDANLVLMDWPIGSDAVKDEHKSMVENVIAGTNKAVAVVRGSVAGQAHNVVVATEGGPDTESALRLGSALASGEGGRLSVLSVCAPMQSETELKAKLRGIVAVTGVTAEVIVRTDADAKELLVKATDEHEVLIVGLTRDRAISRSLSGSFWMDLIRQRTEPTILVRRGELVQARWARRLWEAAFHTLPTLSISERAEVYAQMRHSARASIDFYVLIIIASAIATFGLFQNSAAVIIGAMLVAPLMSPIVAIAQGIVQGNLRMVRKGLSSTLKGTTVSVAVATLFTLLAPSIAATEEILARTEPTLLDLGVGLAAGAAAAYGVSRKSVAASLPGVAIAVALVPPLCVLGYGIGSNQFDVAIGSGLLYLTNLVAIVLVAAIVFLLLGFYPRHEERRTQVRGAVALTVLGMLLLAVPLGLSSYETTRVDRLEEVVERAFRREADERRVHLDTVEVKRKSGVFVVRAVVFSSHDLEVGALNALRDEIEEETGMSLRLEIHVVKAEYYVTDAGGQRETPDTRGAPPDAGDAAPPPGKTPDPEQSEPGDAPIESGVTEEAE